MFIFKHSYITSIPLFPFLKLLYCRQLLLYLRWTLWHHCFVGLPTCPFIYCKMHLNWVWTATVGYLGGCGNIQNLPLVPTFLFIDWQAVPSALLSYENRMSVGNLCTCSFVTGGKWIQQMELSSLGSGALSLFILTALWSRNINLSLHTPAYNNEAAFLMSQRVWSFCQL